MLAAWLLHLDRGPSQLPHRVRRPSGRDVRRLTQNRDGSQTTQIKKKDFFNSPSGLLKLEIDQDKTLDLDFKPTCGFFLFKKNNTTSACINEDHGVHIIINKLYYA